MLGKEKGGWRKRGEIASEGMECEKGGLKRSQGKIAVSYGSAVVTQCGVVVRVTK